MASSSLASEIMSDSSSSSYTSEINFNCTKNLRKFKNKKYRPEISFTELFGTPIMRTSKTSPETKVQSKTSPTNNSVEGDKMSDRKKSKNKYSSKEKDKENKEKSQEKRHKEEEKSKDKEGEKKTVTWDLNSIKKKNSKRSSSPKKSSYPKRSPPVKIRTEKKKSEHKKKKYHKSHKEKEKKSSKNYKSKDPKPDKKSAIKLVRPPPERSSERKSRRLNAFQAKLLEDCTNSSLVSRDESNIEAQAKSNKEESKRKDKKSEKKRKRKYETKDDPQLKVEEPPAKILKKETEEEINQDYKRILKGLQHKIKIEQDTSKLEQVVQLIAETGHFELTEQTFNCDLYVLDRETIGKLQELLTVS